MKAADFVGHLFLARDVSHSVHLNTRSFAKHKALQEFYEGVVGLADDFAEAYQGRHGAVSGMSWASPTAPAKGLCLVRVDYGPDIRSKARASSRGLV